jgi:putative ABC transport system substrate-binding protein
MRRRDFTATLGALMAWPLATRAQQPKKIARMGYLSTGSLDSRDSLVLFEALRQGLREHGYVEGQNIVIELRSAEGRVDRFPALARELVRLEVDVIFAPNTLAARAARGATATIPIVVAVMGDPVGDGLAASLARPGGNVTGFTFIGPQLLPKRLALLKEAIPTVSRVVALWQPGAYGERTMTEMMKEAEAAARTLALHLRLVAVERPDELERAFSTIEEERADALIVYPSPVLFTERRRIVDLSAKRRLPSMYMAREFVELGGLISYGTRLNDLFRRSAMYVDKILKGAKPADLPIEQPTTFELVINLKTARALGLSIQESIIARADEIIE